MSDQKTIKFDKFGYGIFLLKSKNSLFNADFSHEPRQLPDEAGTFYATDKSLKYCIRRWVYDNYDGIEKIFFWRRDKEGGKPMNISENYEHLFDNNSRLAAENLLSCWDVRVFGAVFPVKKKEEDKGESNEKASFSITGPIQITYGINKVKSEQQTYSNQILSPFVNSKKKNDMARTIGNENKALEMHLMFDYAINPKTLRDFAEKGLELTNKDVDLFKEALCRGVSYVNSSAKIGSESEFMLYLESSKHSTLPLLKDYIDVTINDSGNTVIDLNEITELIKGYDEIEKIEAYYEPIHTQIENAPQKMKKFNIFTGVEI